MDREALEGVVRGSRCARNGALIDSRQELKALVAGDRRNSTVAR